MVARGWLEGYRNMASAKENLTPSTGLSAQPRNGSCNMRHWSDRVVEPCEVRGGDTLKLSPPTPLMLARSHSSFPLPHKPHNPFCSSPSFGPLAHLLVGYLDGSSEGNSYHCRSPGYLHNPNRPPTRQRAGPEAISHRRMVDTEISTEHLRTPGENDSSLMAAFVSGTWPRKRQGSDKKWPPPTFMGSHREDPVCSGQEGRRTSTGLGRNLSGEGEGCLVCVFV